jgi:hypothetical protein
VKRYDELSPRQQEQVNGMFPITAGMQGGYLYEIDRLGHVTSRQRITSGLVSTTCWACGHTYPVELDRLETATCPRCGRDAQPF